MDLDAPGVRGYVQQVLDPPVELLPLGEQVVQLHLSEDIPQGGLGEQVGGLEEVSDPDDGLGGVVHPVVDDGVHGDGDVIHRHDPLLRYVYGQDAEVNDDPAVDDWDDDIEAGALRGVVQTTETKDDGTLVLPSNLDC